jgi:hypothetical protein
MSERLPVPRRQGEVVVNDPRATPPLVLPADGYSLQEGQRIQYVPVPIPVPVHVPAPAPPAPAPPSVVNERIIERTKEVIVVVSDRERSTYVRERSKGRQKSDAVWLFWVMLFVVLLVWAALHEVNKEMNKAEKANVPGKPPSKNTQSR